jgi:hypothetical protein
MEHFDIEDSFKRIVVPSLQAKYSLSDGGRRGGPDGSFATVRVTITLGNTSQVSARFPYLVIEHMDGIKPMQWNVHRGIQQQPGTFTGGADDVIHPDLWLHALNLEREFRIRDSYLPRGTLRPPITITFRCGCLHSRPASGTFEITEEEIAVALKIPIA